MKNSIAYRKGIVLILATVFWVFGLQGIGYSQNVSTEADSNPKLQVDQIYDKVIRSVVWIVNTDAGQGSGVLINRDLRIVVTNHHVTKDNETVVVFFPVRDRNGGLIEDRKFYLDKNNLRMLMRLGYATTGRIVAKNPKTDLAIVQLQGLPETAHEIEHNFSYSVHRQMNRNDLVALTQVSCE